MNHDGEITRPETVEDVRHGQGRRLVVGIANLTRAINDSVTRTLNQIVGAIRQILGEVRAGRVDEDDLEFCKAFILEDVVVRTVQLFADVDCRATGGVDYDLSHVEGLSIERKRESGPLDAVLVEKLEVQEEAEPMPELVDRAGPQLAVLITVENGGFEAFADCAQVSQLLDCVEPPFLV